MIDVETGFVTLREVHLVLHAVLRDGDPAGRCGGLRAGLGVVTPGALRLAGCRLIPGLFFAGFVPGLFAGLDGTSFVDTLELEHARVRPPHHRIDPGVFTESLDHGVASHVRPRRGDGGNRNLPGFLGGVLVYVYAHAAQSVAFAVHQPVYRRGAVRVPTRDTAVETHAVRGGDLIGDDTLHVAIHRGDCGTRPFHDLTLPRHAEHPHRVLTGVVVHTPRHDLTLVVAYDDRVAGVWR